MSTTGAAMGKISRRSATTIVVCLALAFAGAGWATTWQRSAPIPAADIARPHAQERGASSVARGDTAAKSGRHRAAT